MLRLPEASVREQVGPIPTPGDHHARRRYGAKLARALFFAAAVVVASACSSGDLGGGGGGGGGPDDAGTGSFLDLSGANGVTATFGATRYTATDNVGSNVQGNGFLFGASKDGMMGSELIWSISGEAEVGTLQRCGDDVQVSLIVQEAGGGATTWGSANCALEVDALGTMAVGGVWPITGRFAGTFVNLATPAQSFTVTDGVFHYTAF